MLKLYAKIFATPQTARIELGGKPLRRAPAVVQWLDVTKG